MERLKMQSLEDKKEQPYRCPFCGSQKLPIDMRGQLRCPDCKMPVEDGCCQGPA